MRNAADKLSDYIRGGETINTPCYGSSLQSCTESYDWTDGYGNYLNSNDLTFNLNQNEVGDWQLPQPPRGNWTGAVKVGPPAQVEIQTSGPSGSWLIEPINDLRTQRLNRRDSIGVSQRGATSW